MQFGFSSLTVAAAVLLAAQKDGAEAFSPNVAFRSKTVLKASEVDVDVSIPYDAAAKLAYEASDKSSSYEDFKTEYEANAVAEVIAKMAGVPEPPKPVAPAAPTPPAVPKPPAVPTPPAAPAAPVSASKAETPEEKAGALVAINEKTVEFTAGLTGGVAGLVIGGPVLGVISAAAANYVSRVKDSGEAGEIVNAVSTKSIEVYNWLAQLDEKYEVMDSSRASLEEALGKLKKLDAVNPETVKKVEDALEVTKNRIAEINEEYDIIGGGVVVLCVVGDLVEKTVTKASQLNEEYQLTNRAIDALKNAVSKAKEAAASKVQA